MPCHLPAHRGQAVWRNAEGTATAQLLADGSINAGFSAIVDDNILPGLPVERVLERIERAGRQRCQPRCPACGSAEPLTVDRSGFTAANLRSYEGVSLRDAVTRGITHAKRFS